MTDLSEWALREAQERYQDGEFTPYPLREEEDRDILVRGVALALAAARRRGIEEAAVVADPKHKPRLNRSTGSHGIMADACSKMNYNARVQLAAAIRALADREPT